MGRLHRGRGEQFLWRSKCRRGEKDIRIKYLLVITYNKQLALANTGRQRLPSDVRNGHQETNALPTIIAKWRRYVKKYIPN